MYLDYFGLDKDPFTIAPDPAFLYPSPQHRQALAHLKYGLDREGGFILLTGEVGTGKTTLTRLLLEQLPGNIRVAYILNAKLNSEDVLASICQELGLEYDAGCSIKSLTDIIYKDLLATHSQGKKTLLVIEEAQNLDPDVLETLRLLTNLETNTTKLLHILLVGQPELLDLIARNELRQLNQRVISRFHIEPLNLQETTNYLAHRLRKAGCPKPVFDASAVKSLHKLSDGIPRMLNLLAERCLLGAYATNSSTVTTQIVKSASQEVLGHSLGAPKSHSDKSVFWMRAMIAALLVVLGVFYFGINDEKVQEQLPTDDVVLEPGSIVDIKAETAEAMVSGESLSQLPMPEVVTLEVKEEPEVKEELVIETEPVVQPKNSYEQLLALWGINTEVSNQKTLCSIAESNALECRFEEQLEVKEIAEINRPGLVSLPGDQDSISVYLIRFFTDDEIQLVNSSGSASMAISDFEAKWNGEFVYLWRPPPQYSNLLYPGVKNPDMVNWVQEQLGQTFDDYEYIIGGGIYSETIVQAVAKFQSQQGLKPDGLLGPRTILRFMDQTEELPRLDQSVEAPNSKAL